MIDRQTDGCTHTLSETGICRTIHVSKVTWSWPDLAVMLTEYFFGDCERQHPKSDFPGTLSCIVPFSRVAGTATLVKMDRLHSAKKGRGPCGLK